MTTPHHRPRGNVLVLASLLTMALVLSFVSPASAKRKKSFYQQTNLVSDLPGLAARTDPHLVNPWGMSRSSTSPFWVSDNGTGVTTLYNGNTGQPLPLVVTIPPPAGSTPTGQVFNPTSDFVVTSGAASGKSFFIFATEDGTISGWNPCVPPPPGPCNPPSPLFPSLPSSPWITQPPAQSTKGWPSAALPPATFSTPPISTTAP